MNYPGQGAVHVRGSGGSHSSSSSENLFESPCRNAYETLTPHASDLTAESEAGQSDGIRGPSFWPDVTSAAWHKGVPGTSNAIDLYRGHGGEPGLNAYFLRLGLRR
jgi:hypothetical protein